MDKEKPFFSVVIPLYNKQSYVKETIESALAQTFEDFEIVVVNDGSTDESAEVVSAIKDDRIRLIHQDNAGVSVARNRGIKEANAKYVAFLDADDLWLPGFLQTIYKLIQKCPDAGLYATSYMKEDSQGNSKPINIQGLPSKDYIGIIPNYFMSVVQGDNLVWTSATCIPKAIFVGNDIWFPAGEKYGEDRYVWARVALQFEVAYNTKACAIYRTQAENNTYAAISQLREPRLFLLNLRNFHAEKNNPIRKFWFNKYIQSHLVTVIKRNINNGLKMYALKQLLNSRLTLLDNIILITRLITPKNLTDLIRSLSARWLQR